MVELVIVVFIAVPVNLKNGPVGKGEILITALKVNLIGDQAPLKMAVSTIFCRTPSYKWMDRTTS